MTEIQQKIVRAIARYQLENANENKGIEMQALVDICVDNMWTHSTKAVKEFLKEAKEHKVVIEITNPQGVTILTCPYDNVLLQKIADDYLD